jgi:hypothetical protein
MGCVMQECDVSGHSTSGLTNMLTGIIIPVLFPVTFFKCSSGIYFSSSENIYICTVFPILEKGRHQHPSLHADLKYLAEIAGSLYPARNVSFTWL